MAIQVNTLVHNSASLMTDQTVWVAWRVILDAETGWQYLPYTVSLSVWQFWNSRACCCNRWYYLAEHTDHRLVCLHATPFSSQYLKQYWPFYQTKTKKGNHRSQKHTIISASQFNLSRSLWNFVKFHTVSVNAYMFKSSGHTPDIKFLYRVWLFAYLKGTCKHTWKVFAFLDVQTFVKCNMLINICSKRNSLLYSGRTVCVTFCNKSYQTFIYLTLLHNILNCMKNKVKTPHACACKLGIQSVNGRPEQ